MAAQVHQLTHPPVREALIDIQFTPATDLAILEAFAAELADEFDGSSPIWRTQFGLHLGPEGAGQAQEPQVAQLGLRLPSLQRSYVLQCRLNGFTLSRLSPYDQWEEFKANARRYWERFLAMVAPVDSDQSRVTQITVRYVNELRLPLPLRDFSDYLTAPPEVPASLPQALQSFLQRVVIPLPDDARTVAVITQALDAPQPPADAVSVILDIDVRRHLDIGVAVPEPLWHALDQLRDEKNKIFFNYITVRMLEQIR